MKSARRVLPDTAGDVRTLASLLWTDSHGAAECVELASVSQQGLSWKPQNGVATLSFCPMFDVAAPSTPWQAITAETSRPKSFSFPIATPLTGAVSLPIVAPKLKVSSFQFPNTPGWRNNSIQQAETFVPAEVASIASVSDPQRSAKLSGRTRIRPPGDTIKLEDRLLYVLQPSLETLIGEGSLAFPFHPFAYQFEGVAFLYPRYAAILADEMGLGKTMQAITAVRLLLHAGELRNVLFICPKPLVTNWQREFAQWAPELPVTTIEGDPVKRRWQWQQSEAPVKIANYELLQRDRETVSELGLQFDLVVLDEAQRIKNRASATSQCVRAISRHRSWALTGTPVENSPQDLVGIFEFLAPGYLSADMKPRRMGRAVSDYVLRRRWPKRKACCG